MTKLNNKRIKWLVVRVVKEGKSPSTVAGVYGITPRRVRQLVRSFKQKGKMPELNVNGRPRTVLTQEQIQVIDGVFNDVRRNPRKLYLELRRRGFRIPKNKMYDYLKSKGLVIPCPAKQKKRKRCRYERKYSGSLLHGDGHRASVKHPYCMLWMDDASRKLLSGLESEKSLTNQGSIRTMQEAVKETWKYNVVISQVNKDRGSEFFSNQKKSRV